MSPGRTPFCGPKTAVAPRSPQSGLLTSDMIVIAESASLKSSPLASAFAACARPAGVGAICWPASSEISIPSAASIPAPPSLVLLPPTPTMNRRTPESRSAPINSPTPLVERAVTSTAMPSASVMPTISAASMIAVLPSRASTTPYAAARCLPPAPVTARVFRSPPRREHRVKRAFAAVGHRARANLGVGPHAPQAARDGRADRGRGKRALERVGGNDDNRRARRRHGV
jgi:hypothetical protein